MATMRTFDADGWTPRELVAPDGRRWTASTRPEEGELLARGYRIADPAPEGDGEGAADPVAPPPSDTAPAQPAATAGQPAAPPVDAADQAPARPRRPRTTASPSTEPTEEPQA